MKPRQPHRQYRTPVTAARLMSSLSPGLSSKGGIGGVSARTASFAQAIGGKYGYRIGDPFGPLSLVFLQADGGAPEQGMTGTAVHREWFVQLQLQLEALRHPEAPKLPSLQRTLVQLVPVWMRQDIVRQASGTASRAGSKERPEPEAAQRNASVRWKRGGGSVTEAVNNVASGVLAQRRSTIEPFELLQRPYWKHSEKAEPATTLERRPRARRQQSTIVSRMHQTGFAIPNDIRTQHRVQRFFDNSTDMITTQINAAALFDRKPAASERPLAVQPDVSLGFAPDRNIRERQDRRSAVTARRTIAPSAVHAAARKLMPPVSPAAQRFRQHWGSAQERPLPGSSPIEAAPSTHLALSVRSERSLTRRPQGDDRSNRGASVQWQWTPLHGHTGETARRAVVQRMVLQRKHNEFIELSLSPEKQTWATEAWSGEVAPLRVSLPMRGYGRPALGARQAASLQRMQVPQIQSADSLQSSGLTDRFSRTGAAANAVSEVAAMQLAGRTVRAIAPWLTHLYAAYTGRDDGLRPSAERRNAELLSSSAPAALTSRSEAEVGYRDASKLQRKPAERAVLVRKLKRSAGEEWLAPSFETRAAPAAAVFRSAAHRGEGEGGSSEDSHEASLMPLLVAQAVLDSFGIRAPDELGRGSSPQVLQLMRSRSELERFTAWAVQRIREQETGPTVPAAGLRPDAVRSVRRRPLSQMSDKQSPFREGSRRTMASLEAAEQDRGPGLASTVATMLQSRRSAQSPMLQAGSYPGYLRSSSEAEGNEADGRGKQLDRYRASSEGNVLPGPRPQARRSGGKVQAALDGGLELPNADGGQRKFLSDPAAIAETRAGTAAAVGTARQAGRSLAASLVQLARLESDRKPRMSSLPMLSQSIGLRTVSSPAIAAARIASVASPIGARAAVLRASRDHRFVPAARMTERSPSPPPNTTTAQSAIASSTGRAEVRESAHSATFAANARQAPTVNARLASSEQPVPSAIVRSESSPARSAPSFIARKASPARLDPLAVAGTASLPARLTPSVIARKASSARLDPSAVAGSASLSARLTPSIIARKAPPVRLDPSAVAGTAFLPARLTPSVIARKASPERLDPSAMAGTASSFKRLASAAITRKVSSERHAPLAVSRTAATFERPAPSTVARKASLARPVSPADVSAVSPEASAEWRFVRGNDQAAQAERPVRARRKPATANSRQDGEEALTVRTDSLDRLNGTRPIGQQQLEQVRIASLTGWKGRRLSRLHEPDLTRPRVARPDSTPSADSNAMAVQRATVRLQRRRGKETAVEAAPLWSRLETASTAAGEPAVRRMRSSVRAEPATERFTHATLPTARPPAIRQARTAARMNVAGAEPAANALPAASLSSPAAIIAANRSRSGGAGGSLIAARHSGGRGEAQLRRQMQDGNNRGIAHRTLVQLTGERPILTGSSTQSLSAAARAAAAIGRRAAAPANVIQLMVGTLERKAQERSASPGIGRERTHKDDAADGTGNAAVSRSFAMHHFTFEHKSVSGSTAIGPQLGVAGTDAAHLPPALDWLQRKPAVVQAAAPEPEAEQSEPQINIAQLQEIIKKLPQFDVKKLADRVYRELEKKLRFERQTRGL